MTLEELEAFMRDEYLSHLACRVLAAIEQRRGLRALDVVRSTRYLMFITGPPLLRTTMNPGERMRPGGGGHDPVLSGYTANRSPDGAQPREGRADLTQAGGAVRDLGNELVGGDQPSIQTSSRDAVAQAGRKPNRCRL